MTQERFFKFIDNPDLLSTISYEELKTLAFAYPYAHNLRYLLALKAQQEGHPEATRMLQNAATYSLDRTCLFLWVAARQLTPERVELAKEEVLELKPIETIKRELEARAPQLREEKPQAVAAEAMAPPPLAPPLKNVNPPEEPAEAEVARPEQPETVAFTAPVSKTPLPFLQWMSQFHPPVLTSAAAAPVAATPKKAEKEASKTGVAQALAEKSVAENEEVISETLARLLVAQGHRDKAVIMYERLSLSFPEKSAYFAAEIEKLKK